MGWGGEGMGMGWGEMGGYRMEVWGGRGKWGGFYCDG